MKEAEMRAAIQKVIDDWDESYGDTLVEHVDDYAKCANLDIDDVDDLNEIRDIIWHDLAANIDPIYGEYIEKNLGEEAAEYFYNHEYAFNMRSCGNGYKPKDEHFVQKIYEKVLYGFYREEWEALKPLTCRELVKFFKDVKEECGTWSGFYLYDDCRNYYLANWEDLFDASLFGASIVKAEVDCNDIYITLKKCEGHESNITPTVMERFNKYLAEKEVVEEVA